MPKVDYTSRDGRTRTVNEKVAAHLQNKGRGTYVTRDLVAQPILPPPGAPLSGPSDFVAPIHPAVVTANTPTPADVDPAAVTFPEAEKPAAPVANPVVAPAPDHQPKELSPKERRELARQESQQRGGKNGK